jgi:hypothetical protein
MSVGWNVLQYRFDWRQQQQHYGVYDPLPAAPLPHHRHAIIVTGHAIYTGARTNTSAIYDESNWILESYQHGQLGTFIEHIQKGIDILISDPLALLVFTGYVFPPKGTDHSSILSL